MALSLQLLLYLPILIFVYYLLLALYNITLHPLAKFPGPKLAAATRLWEFYYTFLYQGGGRFHNVLDDLHARYGPVVRINPHHIHISDREMYDEIYNFNHELDKRPLPGYSSIQNVPNFADHAMLRKAYNPFFSKTAIGRIGDLIGQRVDKLCLRMREAEGGVVNLSVLFRSLTFDVACKYAIGDDLGLLDTPEKAEVMIRGFTEVFKIAPLLQQWPFVPLLLAISEKLPKWLQVATPSQGVEYVKLWQEHLGPKTRNLMKETQLAVQKGDGDVPQTDHPVLFAGYLKNPSVPASEKTEASVRENTQLFAMAGMETTGFTLSMALYQLLSHKAYYGRVREEVNSLWPQDGSLPPGRALEQLPFLTAVVKESLRMGIGVISQLHRVNHQHPFQYKEWVIPPGTSVSMSQGPILYDPEIYPEPEVFKPERWMQGAASKECDKWFCPFSRGARVCLGQNLAWAELYLTIATIVHRFDLELFETGEAEVMPTRDYFVPMAESEAGVRVIVKKCVA